MGRADVGMLASHRDPPIEWGKKPSPRCDDVRDETDRPLDEMIVVVVAVVVVVVMGMVILIAIVIVIAIVI